jgi:hypothetical protein
VGANFTFRLVVAVRRHGSHALWLAAVFAAAGAAFAHSKLAIANTALGLAEGSAVLAGSAWLATLLIQKRWPKDEWRLLISERAYWSRLAQGFQMLIAAYFFCISLMLIGLGGVVGMLIVLFVRR